ncbi:MAG: N-acetyltransferase [Planctomycetales bacterium]|nr:N-acetyltransferase [Planctomycetales bacterium]
MHFRPVKPSESNAIQQLFVDVFSSSEGEQEGLVLGSFVKRLIETTDHADLFGFVADDGQQVVGAVFFSRLRWDGDDSLNAFILSPMAVRTDRQQTGIGQSLVRHGLDELRNSGVAFVTTYGDPAFYGKVGFQPINPDRIAAPFPLSQPVGWLGQSLTAQPIDSITGNCHCVNALDQQDLW